MGNRKFVPQIGRYLENISEALTVLSFVALAISVITWITTLNQDSYSSSGFSGIQAFCFVIYSVFSIVLSFALQGFTYIVKAAIHYLDKEGEFDEKE